MLAIELRIARAVTVCIYFTFWQFKITFWQFKNIQTEHLSFIRASQAIASHTLLPWASYEMMSSHTFLPLLLTQCVLAFALAHPDLPGALCKTFWALYRSCCVRTCKNLLKLKSQVISLALYTSLLNLAFSICKASPQKWLTVACNRIGALHAERLMPQLSHDMSTWSNVTLLVVAFVLFMSAYSAFNRRRVVRKRTGTASPQSYGTCGSKCAHNLVCGIEVASRL